jgi:hypothetical protein
MMRLFYTANPVWVVVPELNLLTKFAHTSVPVSKSHEAMSAMGDSKAEFPEGDIRPLWVKTPYEGNPISAAEVGSDAPARPLSVMKDG